MTESSVGVLQRVVKYILAGDSIQRIAPLMGLSDTTLRTIRDGKANVSWGTLDKLRIWLGDNGFMNEATLVESIQRETEYQRRPTLHVDTIERRELTIELQKLGDADEISRVSGVKRSEVGNLYRVRRPADPETVPALFAWLRENHPDVASRLDETIQTKTQHQHKSRGGESVQAAPDPVSQPSQEPEGSGAMMAMEVIELLEAMVVQIPPQLVDLYLSKAVMVVDHELDLLEDLGQLSQMEMDKRAKLDPLFEAWINNSASQKEWALQKENRKLRAQLDQVREILGKSAPESQKEDQA
jgi:hypothetical protein